jgi:hypothetical protein
MRVAAVWLAGNARVKARLNVMRRSIIHALNRWQCARDSCDAAQHAFSDIPAGTERLASLVDAETLARLKEIRRGSNEAHEEFQTLFDAEAARLGLTAHELGYLSNLISGWYAEQQRA